MIIISIFKKNPHTKIFHPSAVSIHNVKEGEGRSSGAGRRFFRRTTRKKSPFPSRRSSNETFDKKVGNKKVSCSPIHPCPSPSFQNYYSSAHYSLERLRHGRALDKVNATYHLHQDTDVLLSHARRFVRKEAALKGLIGLDADEKTRFESRTANNLIALHSEFRCGFFPKTLMCVYIYFFGIPRRT